MEMDIERLERELAEAQRRVETAVDSSRGAGDALSGRRWRRRRAGAELAAAEAEYAAARDAESAAERALAAARGEEYVVPFDIGVRWRGGGPLPHLLSWGSRSFVAFYLDTRDESLGLAEFKGCVSVKI